MNRIRTIVIFSSLSSLRALIRTFMTFSSLSSLRIRRAARQIDLPSWEAGEDCRLVGPTVGLLYVCDEMSLHGFVPVLPSSDLARALMTHAGMQVVQVPHPKGVKTWVISNEAHINVGGSDTATSPPLAIAS